MKSWGQIGSRSPRQAGCAARHRPPPPTVRTHCPVLNSVYCPPCPSASGVSTTRPLHLSSFYSLAEEDLAQKAVGGWCRADETADSSWQRTKRHRGAWKTMEVFAKMGGTLKAANKARKQRPSCRESRTPQFCLAPAPHLQT